MSKEKTKLETVSEAFKVFQEEHNVEVVPQLRYDVNGCFPIIAVKDLDEQVEEVEAEVVEG